MANKFKHAPPPRDYQNFAGAAALGVLILTPAAAALAAWAVLAINHLPPDGVTRWQGLGLVAQAAGWRPEPGSISAYLMVRLFGLSPWPSVYAYMSAAHIYSAVSTAATWTRLAALVGAAGGIFAGWRLTDPGPGERHIRGRQLSDDPRAAAAEMSKEIKVHGAGIHIHPEVQISLDRETRGLFVLGSPGSGKTQIIKRLLTQITGRGDRLIIWDVKGDYTSVLGHLKGVRLLAPWDRRAVAWDVGADVPGRADARELAARLVRAPKGGASDMWSNGARIILSAYIMHTQAAAHKQVRDWTMQELADLCARTNYRELVEIMRRWTPEGVTLLGELYDAAAGSEDEGGGGPNRTTQGFLATLAAYLSPVYDLADAWSQSGHGGKRPVKFSVRRWLTEPDSREAEKTKILIIAGHPRFSEIAKAQAQSIIGVIGGLLGPDLDERRGQGGTWVVLDEAAQLGRVDGLAPLIEVGRSKGLRVVLGTQDISQLIELYSREIVQTWASMLGSYIVCRTQGNESPEWISNLIGERRVRRYRPQISRQQNALGATHSRTSSDSWEIVSEPVITPDEIGSELGAGPKGVTALLVTGGATVYRLCWPYITLPDRVKPVVLAPWTAPGWHRDAAEAGVTSHTEPTPGPTKPRPPVPPEPAAENEIPDRADLEPVDPEPEPQADEDDMLPPDDLLPVAAEDGAQADEAKEPDPEPDVAEEAGKEIAAKAGAHIGAEVLPGGAAAMAMAETLDLVHELTAAEAGNTDTPAPMQPAPKAKKTKKVLRRKRRSASITGD